MFNNHCKLKLLSVTDTRFTSTIVMLKQFKMIKRGFEQLVISEEWEMYKEDDLVKAKKVKDKILNEDFWMDVDYILSFTTPMYEMLRLAVSHPADPDPTRMADSNRSPGCDTIYTIYWDSH